MYCIYKCVYANTILLVVFIYICVPTESQKLATYFTTRMHVLQQKCSREQKMLTKLATYFTTRMYVYMQTQYYLLYLCMCTNRNVHVNKKMLTKLAHLFYYTYVCVYSYIYANRNVHVNKKMLTKLATYFTTRMYTTYCICVCVPTEMFT